jgi:hypothetical protein
VHLRVEAIETLENRVELAVIEMLAIRHCD